MPFRIVLARSTIRDRHVSRYWQRHRQAESLSGSGRHDMRSQHDVAYQRRSDTPLLIEPGEVTEALTARWRTLWEVRGERASSLRGCL